MLYFTLGALALSTLAIIALCLGDPKRRRAVGGKAAGMTSGQRRFLVAIACVPGLVCMILGDAAAFLMWLGGCALVGWTLAAGFRTGSMSE